MKLAPMIDLKRIRVGAALRLLERMPRSVRAVLHIFTRRGFNCLCYAIDAWSAANPLRSWVLVAVAVVIWVALWSRK
jgi:hypothetical protein